MHAMMKSIVDELKTLETNHPYVIKAQGDKVINLKTFLIGATCDKPAQAIVQNVSEPIGEFGCGRCEIRGKFSSHFKK